MILQFSLALNGVLLLIGTFWGVRSYQQSLDSDVQSHLAKLDAQILVLKKDLILSKISSEIPSIPVKEYSDEYKMFLIKIALIVGAIVLISWLVYVLSAGLYSYFFQSSIGKLLAISNNLTLKLFGFFSVLGTKKIDYFDGGGNHFIISLDSNQKVVDILAQSAGTNIHMPIMEFVALHGPTVVTGSGGVLESAVGLTVLNPSTLAVDAALNLAYLEHMDNLFK